MVKTKEQNTLRTIKKISRTKNDYSINKKHIFLYFGMLFLGLLLSSVLFFTNNNKVISLFISLGYGLITGSIVAPFIERINKRIAVDNIKKKRKMLIQDTLINLDLLRIYLLNRSVAYCKEIDNVFKDISEDSVIKCIDLYINNEASK